MILLDLFLAFFRIGLFAVGGAYSFLPLIEKEAVEKYHWLSQAEFLNVLGAVNLFPGAISIKYATYTGYKLAGIPGVIAANLGNLLAPAVLIIIGAALYARFKDLPRVRGAFNVVQLAVFAMILAVAFKTVTPAGLFTFSSLIIVGASFGLFMLSSVHPALIIVGAALIGALWF